MATPKTVLTYPLNGSQKDFPIPFEYLARKFVQVTLIGVDRKLLVLNTDYRFSTRTTITTTIAWGAAQGYNLIEIRRYTSASERLVDFSDGSILRAYDLNTAQVQSLHIAEEGRDIATDTIGVDNNGQLDARGRRIVNLADAVADSDAVTLRQEKAWAASALNQADRAKAQADIATTQATASAQQAGASQTARLASEGARDLALQYRNTAETHKNAAATSAQNSEASNVLSQAWASKVEDSVVSGGLYSSYHYSRKSLTYANQSAESASESQTAREGSEQARDLSLQYSLDSAANAANAVGVGLGFIAGIHPTLNLSNLREFTFSTGSAMIPSTGRMLHVTAPITVLAPTPSAGVWYYAYIYAGAGGAPAIEVVTTAPAAPYSGTARYKTGDQSRRFVCALLGAASGYMRTRLMADGTYRFLQSVNGSPFRILTATRPLAPSTINLSAAIPPTTQTAVVVATLAPGGSSFDCLFNLPDAPTVVMNYAAGDQYQGTRTPLQLPTDASQRISIYLLGADPGTLTLDVCGFGADR